MKHTIITTDNQKIEVACIGCAISRKEVAMIGGIIAETPYFEITHDFEIPIPGFFIINSKRHFAGFADFTDHETRDFSAFLVRVRKALKEALDIHNITIIQEEKTANSHFHVWLFPWQDWMVKVGSGLSSIRPILEYARAHHETDGILREIEKKSKLLKEHLA